MKSERLSDYLLSKKENGEKALVSFLTAGYPDAQTWPRVLSNVMKSSDLVEVGFPFSDPLADGSTIQRTSQEVLKQGWSWNKFFRSLSPYASRFRKPLLLMSYFNPVLQYGLDACAERLAAIGFRGALFPDLPIEEGKDVERAMNRHGIEVAYLLSTTTSFARAKVIVRRTQGFVYLVSLKGVTGARKEIPQETLDYLKKIRPITSKPIYLGFGLASPGQVRRYKPLIDGVIIGSALLNRIGRNVDDIKKATMFLSRFKRAL